MPTSRRSNDASPPEGKSDKFHGNLARYRARSGSGAHRVPADIQLGASGFVAVFRRLARSGADLRRCGTRGHIVSRGALLSPPAFKHGFGLASVVKNRSLGGRKQINVVDPRGDGPGRSRRSNTRAGGPRRITFATADCRRYGGIRVAFVVGGRRWRTATGRARHWNEGGNTYRPCPSACADSWNLALGGHHYRGAGARAFAFGRGPFLFSALDSADCACWGKQALHRGWGRGGGGVGCSVARYFGGLFECVPLSPLFS